MKNKIQLYRYLRILTHQIDHYICTGKWKRYYFNNSVLGYSKKLLGTTILVSFRTYKDHKNPDDLLICFGIESSGRHIIKINDFDNEILEVINAGLEIINEEFK